MFRGRIHSNHINACWRRYRVLLITPLLLHRAWGWGEIGHEAVAKVARHFMTADATSATRALLGDESLETASLWADEIRKQPGYEWSRPLHYANVVEGEKSFELERDCKPTTGCVVSAILTDMSVLGSSTETTQRKSEALKFLIHFVGDVHQPLHVSRAADRGGNLIMVTFTSATINLHALWDSGLIESQYNSADELSQELLNAITPELHDQWCSLDPAAWADASYQYALSNAYAIPANAVIDEAYVQRNLPIIRMRLAQAGVRLAAVLNVIFEKRDVSGARSASNHWPAALTAGYAR